jgi:hypothetical protein
MIYRQQRSWSEDSLSGLVKLIVRGKPWIMSSQEISMQRGDVKGCDVVRSRGKGRTKAPKIMDWLRWGMSIIGTCYFLGSSVCCKSCCSMKFEWKCCRILCWENEFVGVWWQSWYRDCILHLTTQATDNLRSWSVASMNGHSNFQNKRPSLSVCVYWAVCIVR